MFGRFEHLLVQNGHIALESVDFIPQMVDLISSHDTRDDEDYRKDCNRNPR